ncbi:hypothetical protein BLNAU_177 [Blattamonas nauphoetae]|uniref:Uncharacterized protein n=1 Tax=Blattamonas nauphoetae TaxID=2049346 RepID=A0ABQ9YM89_9EUKA|nr:hypothetical protein BLNAU_177 [Blattamonas nauphoetae]
MTTLISNLDLLSSVENAKPEILDHILVSLLETPQHSATIITHNHSIIFYRLLINYYDHSQALTSAKIIQALLKNHEENKDDGLEKQENIKFWPKLLDTIAGLLESMDDNTTNFALNGLVVLVTSPILCKEIATHSKLTTAFNKAAISVLSKPSDVQTQLSALQIIQASLFQLGIRAMSKQTKTIIDQACTLSDPVGQTAKDIKIFITRLEASPIGISVDDVLQKLATGLFAPRVNLTITKTTTKADFLAGISTTNHKNRVKAIVSASRLFQTKSLNSVTIGGVTINIENEESRPVVGAILLEMQESKNFDERSLALKGCFGSSDYTFAMKCLSDSSKLIRNRAQRFLGTLLGRKEKKGPTNIQDELLKLAKSLSDKELMVFLAFERKTLRTTTLEQNKASNLTLTDRLVGEMEEHELIEKMWILPLCSYDVILNHRKSFIMHAESRVWAKLQQYNPMALLNILELWTDDLAEEKNTERWNWKEVSYPLSERLKMSDNGRGIASRRRKEIPQLGMELRKLISATNLFTHPKDQIGFDINDNALLERVLTLFHKQVKLGCLNGITLDKIVKHHPLRLYDFLVKAVEDDAALMSEMKQVLPEWFSSGNPNQRFADVFLNVAYAYTNEQTLNILNIITNHLRDMSYSRLDFSFLKRLTRPRQIWLIEQNPAAFKLEPFLANPQLFNYLPEERLHEEARVTYNHKMLSVYVQLGKMKREDINQPVRDASPVTNVDNTPEHIMFDIGPWLSWDECRLMYVKQSHHKMPYSRLDAGRLISTFVERQKSHLVDFLNLIAQKKNDQEEVRCSLINQFLNCYRVEYVKPEEKKPLLEKAKEIVDNSLQALQCSDLTVGTLKNFVDRFTKLDKEWVQEMEAYLEKADPKKYPRKPVVEDKSIKSKEEAKAALHEASSKWTLAAYNDRPNDFHTLLNSLEKWDLGVDLYLFALSYFGSTDIHILSSMFHFVVGHNPIGAERKRIMQVKKEMREEYEKTGIARVDSDRTILWVDPGIMLSSLVPHLLPTVPSFYSFKPVKQFLFQSRTDLLDRFLKRRVYIDLLQNSSSLPDPTLAVINNTFFEGSPVQQKMFKEELERIITKDESVGISDVVGFVRKLSQLGIETAEEFWTLAEKDKRDRVVQRAVIFMRKMDDLRGKDKIPELITDERVGRVAIDLFRGEIVKMEEDKALNIIKSLPETSPAAVKGKIRLYQLLPATDTVFSVVAAIGDSKLHRDSFVALVELLLKNFLGYHQTWVFMKKAVGSKEDQIANLSYQYSTLTPEQFELRLKVKSEDGTYTATGPQLRSLVIEIILEQLDLYPNQSKLRQVCQAVQSVFRENSHALQDEDRIVLTKMLGIVKVMDEPSQYQQLVNVATQIMTQSSEKDRTLFLEMLEDFEGNCKKSKLMVSCLLRMMDRTGAAPVTDDKTLMRASICKWTAARPNLNPLTVAYSFFMHQTVETLLGSLEGLVGSGVLTQNQLPFVLRYIPSHLTSTLFSVRQPNRRQRTEKSEPVHASETLIGLMESKQEVIRVLGYELGSKGYLYDDLQKYEERYMNDPSDLVKMWYWGTRQ